MITNGLASPITTSVPPLDRRTVLATSITAYSCSLRWSDLGRHCAPGRPPAGSRSRVLDRPDLRSGNRSRLWLLEDRGAGTTGEPRAAREGDPWSATPCEAESADAGRGGFRLDRRVVRDLDRSLRLGGRRSGLERVAEPRLGRLGVERDPVSQTAHEIDGHPYADGDRNGVPEGQLDRSDERRQVAVLGHELGDGEAEAQQHQGAPGDTRERPGEGEYPHEIPGAEHRREQDHREQRPTPGGDLRHRTARGRIGPDPSRDHPDAEDRKAEQQ